MSTPWGNMLAHLQRGGSKGFWTYESVARKEGSDYPAERISLWWDSDQPGPLPDLVGPHGPRHVWFGVHPCSEIPPTTRSGKSTRPEWIRSQTEYICAINCLYAEYDGKDFGGKDVAGHHVAGLPHPPSIIIDSGGGYHCYWLLRETLQVTAGNREEIKALQHAWVAAVGGDLGAKNLNRVLRVPGSVNYKAAYAPDYPEVRFLRCEMGRLYDLPVLRAAIPAEALDRADQGDAPTATLDDHDRAPRLLQMLASWRINDYDAWLHVGMALASLGGAGLALWDAWSRGGSTYKAGECERKWRGMGDSGRTFASLVAWAREDSPDAFEREFGRKRHDARGVGLLQASATPKAFEYDKDNDVHRKMICKGVDDEGNAQAVHLLHGSQFLHCDVYGWLHWCGTHWRRQGADSRLERAIVDTLIKRRQAAVALGNESIVKTAKPSATRVRNAMYLFRSLVDVPVESFDSDPDLLNCHNGTIHLPSGELRSHDPRDRLTYCTRVDFKTDADDAEWVSFLRGAVAKVDTPDELVDELVQYLQRCCGYCITGHTSEEVMWYIHGPTRSGKGTFTETFCEILGEPLSTEVDFTTFTRDRDNDANNFDLAPLKPARLIVASESERHQRLNGAKIKALTGGNKVRCSFKGKDHFTYRPNYKIVLTSNHKPNADPDDPAVWGRLRVIVFPNSHLGTEDKTLKQKMRERHSLEGVLAWAVKGARAWYQERGAGLVTPAAVAEETARARDEMDTVGQWIEESLVLDPEHPDVWLHNSEFYQGYANWCEENGVTPKKKAGLTRTLNSKGIEGPKVKKIDGKSQRVWMGVQWS